MALKNVEEKGCQGKVFDGWRSSFCSHKGKVEREGKWYCFTHDPVAREAKKAAREEKWRKENTLQEDRYERRALEHKILQNNSLKELREMENEDLGKHRYEIKASLLEATRLLTAKDEEINQLRIQKEKYRQHGIKLAAEKTHMTVTQREKDYLAEKTSYLPYPVNQEALLFAPGNVRAQYLNQYQPERKAMWNEVHRIICHVKNIQLFTKEGN